AARGLRDEVFLHHRLRDRGWRDPQQHEREADPRRDDRSRGAEEAAQRPAPRRGAGEEGDQDRAPHRGEVPRGVEHPPQPYAAELLSFLILLLVLLLEGREMGRRWSGMRRRSMSMGLSPHPNSPKPKKSFLNFENGAIVPFPQRFICRTTIP